MINIKGAHKVVDPRILDRAYTKYIYTGSKLTAIELYDAPDATNITTRINRTDIIYVAGTSLPDTETTKWYSTLNGTTITSTETTTYTYDGSGNLLSDTTIES